MIIQILFYCVVCYRILVLLNTIISVKPYNKKQKFRSELDGILSDKKLSEDESYGLANDKLRNIYNQNLVSIAITFLIVIGGLFTSQYIWFIAIICHFLLYAIIKIENESKSTESLYQYRLHRVIQMTLLLCSLISFLLESKILI